MSHFFIEKLAKILNFIISEITLVPYRDGYWYLIR